MYHDNMHIFYYHLICHVLIDLWSIILYIIPRVVKMIGIPKHPLRKILSIISPLDASKPVDRVGRGYVVTMGDRGITTGLIIVDLNNQDIIFVIDWLGAYHVVMDYFSKKVTFWILWILWVSHLRIENEYFIPNTNILS